MRKVIIAAVLIFTGWISAHAQTPQPGLTDQDIDSANRTTTTPIPTEVDTSTNNAGVVDTTGSSYSTGVINRSGNKNRNPMDHANPSRKKEGSENKKHKKNARKEK